MHPGRKIVYYVGRGKRSLTNAAFLLGGYMILKHNETAQSVAKCFHWLDGSLIEPFSSPSDSTAGSTAADGLDSLSLVDCWAALEHAKALAWLQVPRSEHDCRWGQIDPDEYEHYHSPLNADLHQIVPGKLAVVSPPADLAGRDYRDEAGVRRFSPAYLVGIFHELGVTDVVSLGAPSYDPRALAAAGVAHRAVDARGGHRLLAIIDAAAGATGPAA